MNPYILCIDDEKTILDALKCQLKNYIGGSYTFECAQSGEEALELIAELTAANQQIAVVISDLFMPGMTGIDLLMRVQELLPGTVTILLTGLDEPKTLTNKAVRFQTLTKPWEKTQLTNLLTQTLSC